MIGLSVGLNANSHRGAGSALPTEPYELADDVWSVAYEATGEARLIVSQSVIRPVGYTLRAYIGPVTSGIGADGQTVEVPTNGVLVTSGLGLAAGETFNARLYWRAVSDGAYTAGSTVKTVTRPAVGDAPTADSQPSALTPAAGSTSAYDLTQHIGGGTVTYYRLRSGALPPGFRLLSNGTLDWADASPALETAAQIDAVGPGGVATLDITISVAAPTYDYNPASDDITEGRIVEYWNTGNNALTMGADHFQISAANGRSCVVAIEESGGADTSVVSDFDATIEVDYTGANPIQGLAFRFNTAVQAGSTTADAGSGYNGYVARMSAFDSQFKFVRYSNGSVTVLGTALSITFPAQNTKYKIRVRAVGETFEAKWWLSSGSEPVDWQITTTDSTYASGRIGMAGFPSNSDTARLFKCYDAQITTPLVVEQTAPAPVTAVAPAAVEIAPGEEVAMRFTGDNALSWSAAAPFPPGVYLLSNGWVAGVAEASGTLSAEGSNNDGATETAATTLAVTAGYRRAPDVLTTQAASAFAASVQVDLGTCHHRVGDADYSRVVVALIHARVVTGTEALALDGVAMTRVATNTGVTSARISAYVGEAPAGDEATLTVGYTAASQFSLSVVTCLRVDLPAMIAAFDTAATGEEGAAIGLPTAAIDVPDHGVVLYLADASPTSYTPLLIASSDTQVDGVVSTATAAYRITQGGALLDTTIGLQWDVNAEDEPLVGWSSTSRRAMLVALSLRGLDSVQTVLGELPLEAQAMDVWDAQPAYVGEAYHLDLRTGYFGFGGSISAALTSGDSAIPSGGEVTPDHLAFIPASTGTLTFRPVLTRGAEEITLPQVTVEVATSSGNLISGAPVSQGGGGTVSAVTNGHSFTMATGSPVAGWDIATTPGRDYRLRCRLDASAVVGANGAAIQALNVVVDETTTANSHRFRESGWLAMAWTAPGTARWVDLTFTAERSTTYIRFGRVKPAEDAGLTQEAAAVVVTGARLELLPEPCAIGAQTTTRFLRDGPVTFIFDEAVTVSRLSDGSYAVAPGDASLLAAAPVYRRQPYRAISFSDVGLSAYSSATQDVHGLVPNWGVEGGLGNKRPQGFGGLGGDGPYQSSRNADPHALLRPLALSTAQSLSKAVFPDVAVNLDRGNLIADIRTLTVAALPETGRTAFRPPLATPTKAWVYEDQVQSATLAGLSLTRPADWPAVSYDVLVARLHDFNASIRSPSANKSGQPRRWGYWYGEDRFGAIGAAMAELMFDTLTSGQKATIAKKLVQIGLTLYGAMERPSALWRNGGGGTLGPKFFQTFAAGAFTSGVQSSFASGLGVARTLAQQAAATTLFAEDLMTAVIGDALIGETLTVSSAGAAARPRAAFTDEHRFMPVWRSMEGDANTGLNGTGANRYGDGYHGGSVLPAVSALAACHALGLSSLWTGRAADMLDRSIGLYAAYLWPAKTNEDGDYDQVSDRLIADATLAIYALGRGNAGKPVALHRNGLTDTVPVDPSITYRAALVPITRSWTVDVLGTLDVAATDFANSTLFPDWPSGSVGTSYALTAAWDAAGSSISVPGWASINAAGLLSATPPDTALRFIEVTATNGSGSAATIVAIQASA